MSRNAVLFSLLAVLFILNGIDAIITYHYVTSGLAEEINPIMKYLLDIHPNLFLAYKFLFSFISILLFWKFKEMHYKLVLTCASVSVLMYLGLFCYHVYLIHYLL